MNVRTCHGEGNIIELKVEEFLAHARIQGQVKIWSGHQAKRFGLVLFTLSCLTSKVGRIYNIL